MVNSILTSTKKILGVGADYSAFDIDIITHINSSLSIISQIGIGPDTGFFIVDDEAEWSDIGLPDNQLALLRTYVYLKVRMLFDPPSTSFVIDAMNKQIAEHEARLSYYRENLLPAPTPPTEEDDEIEEGALFGGWGA